MYELAEVVLDKVVKLEPDNPQAHLLLGLGKFYSSSYIFVGLNVHVKLSAKTLMDLILQFKQWHYSISAYKIDGIFMIKTLITSVFPARMCFYNHTNVAIYCDCIHI